MPAAGHFPSTHGTWIEQQIARAAVHDVAHGAESKSAPRQHLMERYYEPLCIYVKARPESSRIPPYPDVACVRGKGR